MSRVRRGILASFADKYLSQLVALVTVAVMSRILSPAEIGLFLVANSVIMLADNFRSFGVGIYIVQVPELRRESVQSAFTVTLAMSLVIGLGILASAEPIARFYDEQDLAHLLRVAVLAFCTIPFASPILALMQRDLAFGTMAWLNVATAIVNAAVTVALALSGLGPVSYVWGYVVSSSFLSLGCIALRPDLGIFRPSLRDAGHIMTFGGVSTAVTLVNMANDMLPRLAFAKIIGFDAAGLYGRALTLCQLPDRAVLSALQPVVLPAMAAHARAGGELKTVYLKGLALVTAVQWPVLMMLALLADPVVRVILGPQWDAAAPLLRIMALAAMALAPAFMTFPVLVSAGRIRDTLWSSLISLPPSMAITVVAAFFGMNAVAASFLVVAPFQMFVALVFVRRAIGIAPAELMRAARASLLLTLAAAVLPAGVILASSRGFDLSLLEAGVAIAGSAVGWFSALRWLDHPIGQEIGAILRRLRVRTSTALQPRRRPDPTSEAIPAVEK